MIWGNRHICLPGAMLMLCALVAGGCAECRPPSIDPTGERVFAPPPGSTNPGYKNEPGAPRPWDTVELLLVPRSTAAPVGSEIVLLAAVSGHDGYLRASERVEWSIAPGGVGEFVDFDRASFCDVFVGDFRRPEKINSTYVVGTTSRRYVRLTRGTPTPTDDVTVLRGQTWVSIRSPVEGTSYVTAYAPDVYGWEQRKQTAIIYWFDAQWRFPPPAITPTGSRHTFTTMVMRQTDQTPLAGWRVQYSIADGPAAGFAPNGAPTVEVETNAAGQASAEIIQQQPASGTNRIAIQVIRPPRPGDPSDTRLVVGSGFTSKTWTAPGLAVRKSGPAAASVGAILPYRIEVTNTGDMPSDGVVLTDDVPEAFSYMSSSPPGQLLGRSVQWQVGRLGPGERRVFDVSLRAERQGSVSLCAEAAAGALRAKDCVTTAISLAVPPTVSSPGGTCVGPAGAAPPLDVKVTGPQQAYVGDVLTFQIVITNRGTSPATGIVIKDSYDRGLVHETLPQPIKKSLAEALPAGGVRQVDVQLHAAAAGRQCQTVEITADGGSVASAQFCTTVLDRGATSPTTPTPTGPGPAGSGPTPSGVRGRVSVRVSVAKAIGADPNRNAARESADISVGDNVDFFIVVDNEGASPLTNLKMASDLDPSLKPMFTNQPESSYRFEGDNTIVFTLASLASGEKKEYVIRCQGAKESPRACVRATATANEADSVKQEVCVQIRPTVAASAAPLSVDITTLHDPVAAGKSLTYVVLVTNRGKVDDSQVVVRVTVPPEMIPSLLETYPRANVKGQTVEFPPADRIAAGDTLTYRVRVQAKTPGEVRLQAQVTSRNQTQPVSAERKTTIIAGQ